MIKALLFIRLYIHTWCAYLLRKKDPTPIGIKGSAVFVFWEDEVPYGVVAFILPLNYKAEDYIDDLWGPFGYTSSIRLNGMSLYARDTWGTASYEQIQQNRPLSELTLIYPQHDIMLAGVRRLWMWHIWPLNIANRFILVKK